MSSPNTINSPSPTDVRLDIPTEPARWCPRECIHRVPPYLRRDNNKHVYDPVVLSIGPYHYGKPQLGRLEEYKKHVLHRFTSLWGPTSQAFSQQILQRIREVRDSYEDVRFDDQELAEIIIRDTYFVVSYMESGSHMQIITSLGMSTVAFLDCDFFMLENQIPFWVVKCLLDLRHGGRDGGDAFVRRYLSVRCFGYSSDQLPGSLLQDEEHQPLHLLVAFKTTLVAKQTVADQSIRKEKLFDLNKIFKRKSKHSKDDATSGNSQKLFKRFDLPFRSVTYLQAKGIYFGLSSSCCFNDIRFTSYPFYGKLQLPVWAAHYYTKAFYSNMIACEMSQGEYSDFTVTSYVNFMKSLIQDPKDVKELREKGIFSSRLGNDEEVVKMFKEIDTYELGHYDAFADVRRSIDEHCSSKANTWMAELMHKYFRSPWSTIAVCAAIALLVLTFLQTYFTINPSR